MSLAPTPTDHGLTPCQGRFATLTEALDYAAGGRSGMNFHAARGQLAEVLSYAQLAEDARLTGARLLSTGLQPGDRVGLIAETHGDFVRAFMGCLYAHLVPCPMPLPVAFGARQHYGSHIQRITRVADAHALIAPEDYLDWVAEPLASENLQFVGPLAALPDQRAALPAAKPDPEGLAYLQFSSGTTRTPKGVAIQHRAMMANVAGMAGDVFEIGREDRGVSWLPFYHDMGLVGCMILPIATQMSVDYLATRDFVRRPALWLTMLSRAGGTISYAPSFGYELAARRAAESLDLSRWRVAGIGGDMIKAANLAEFVNVYRPHGFREESLMPSYGMAEVALGLTFARRDSGCRFRRLDVAALEKGKVVAAAPDQPNSRDFAICGTALPGHRLEIRDEAGRVLEDGCIGIVFAQGPSVMQGYFGDAASTAEALDADGWLNTGDIGFIDEAGSLVLTGRAKDLIIINGRNIWPQDIEWTVERRIDGTREGGVVAFGVNGAAGSDREQLTLVIECRKPAASDRETLISQADALVREIYGIAPRIALSTSGFLPRTSSGKLSRSRAREMFLAGDFDG